MISELTRLYLMKEFELVHPGEKFGDWTVSGENYLSHKALPLSIHRLQFESQARIYDTSYMAVEFCYRTFVCQSDTETPVKSLEFFRGLNHRKLSFLAISKPAGA